jgi:hypothetical protein
MSNRNFDSSAIIQRLKDRTTAQSIYKANQAGLPIVSNPQNSNSSPQVIMDAKEGAGTTYMKNLGGGYTVNQGGTCN